MKKTKKQQLTEGWLTSEELKLLKGGTMVRNVNDTPDCNCTYKDTTVSLTNKNEVGGCSCTCI
ncbi:MAG TPA: hypothetical protein DHV28_00705 [Ignavibacteriales bacterium]|nr:hypothetical protein [Ignavibacteriales bacterium]